MEAASSADGRPAVALTEASLSPTRAEEYFDLAMRLAAQRGGDDLERAIELFNKALEIDPDDARTHAELANAYALSVRGFYRDLSRFDLAIEHATTALGLEPTTVAANKALGLAFAGKGWLSSAVREYERALELRPDYQAVINNLAIIEVNRGNLTPRLRRHCRAGDLAVLPRAARRSPLSRNRLGFARPDREDAQRGARHLRALIGCKSAVSTSGARRDGSANL